MSLCADADIDKFYQPHHTMDDKGHVVAISVVDGVTWVSATIHKLIIFI
jgi:hypothetical protein